MSIVNLENVSYSVDGKNLLTNISFTSREKRVAVVGRNGSGKSTLARLLAGLIVPTSGSLSIDSHDMATERQLALRTVGILFQNPDHQIIFPTVEEEIGFGLRQQGNSKQVAAEKTQFVLQRFGKAHWLSASTSQLSQGQRQLVCLMSVLAMEPSLIILDEPFSGLDIPTTLQLQRYLDALDQTLIHITHSPESVRAYDRTIWLERGRIERDGPAVDTLDAFSTRMTSIGSGDDLSSLTR